MYSKTKKRKSYLQKTKFKIKAILCRKKKKEKKKY